VNNFLIVIKRGNGMGGAIGRCDLEGQVWSGVAGGELKKKNSSGAGLRKGGVTNQ